MKNAVIYARYSCSGQREQSIEDQVADCKKFARSNGYEVINIYADHAKSGRSDNRANFQRMLKDSDSQAFEVVIVWKLDRFGRNREEMAFNRYHLKKNGVKVISAMEHISDDPVGALTESLLEGMAEFYSLNLSENVKRGMYSNAEKAKCNGRLPIGYKNNNGTIELDENYSGVIKKIFDMLYQGYSMVEVEDYLNNNGIMRPNGKPFKRHALDNIKKNQRYIGTYIYGDIVIPNGIPKIVDPEIFYAVNQRRHNKKMNDENAKETFLFRGKVYCGNCGNLYVGDTGTGKSGKIYRYYKCAGQKERKSVDCSNKVFKKEEFENKVLERIFNEILQDDIIDLLSENIIRHYNEKPDSIADELLYQKDEIERKIENLLNAIENGATSEVLLKKLDDYEIKLRKLESSLAIEKSKRPTPTKEAICWALKNFKLDFIKDEHDKLNLINNLVDTILVKDDYIQLNMNFLFRNENGKVVPSLKCSTNSLMVRQEEILLNTFVLNEDYTFSYAFEFNSSPAESSNIIFRN